MNREDGLVLLLGATLAVGASLGTNLVTADREDPRVDPGTATLRQTIERLERTVSELEEEQRELSAALAERDALLTSPSTGRSEVVGRGGIDAAVARWMEANAPSLAAGAVDGVPVVESDAIEAAVDRILSGSGDDDAFWKELRDSGRLDAVLARLEQEVEATPLDAELRVALADTYVQKVFDVGPGPMQAHYNELADQAYDEALRLDDNHWNARFSKAIALSNWPAFLGKSGEAIRQFEVLLEQQERRPVEGRFSNTYFFLGNMYEGAGQSEKALATWRRGLELFPDSGRLRSQLATSEGRGAGGQR